MKKLLFLLVICGFSANLFAQKLYVWLPETNNTAKHPVFEQADTVDLVFLDGRNFPTKSKVECTSEEFIEYLTNDIQTVYQGATFNILPTTYYYKPPKNNHVTIKIGIAAYHAGFGADIDVAIGAVGGQFAYGISTKGQWNGITLFYVQVSDMRNNSNNTQRKEVFSTISKPNIGGYRTAKKCLNESYAQTFNQMVFFIDSVFF